MSTAKDIAEIKDLLARIDERQQAGTKQLEANSKRLDTMAGKIDKTVSDQDKRLRKVENRQTWLSGAYAAIGAVIGIGGWKITAG